MMQYPIDSALPELFRAFQEHQNAVLVAPPGAGKTTRVPLALLNEPWLNGKKIIILEPRRLAARASAHFMARSLGERVGERIGYRVRQDTKISDSTRIEVITEGVLTRMLQEDPALEQAGIVIFDEYHERSLQADLGLALCLQSQSLLRSGLRLLVMSATLEAEPVAGLLGNAPIVRSEGRSFPVETHYIDKRIDGRKEHAIVPTILRALSQGEGDLLVFLPGSGEIRTVQRLLEEAKPGAYVKIAPLYGALSQAAQDEAIAPARPGIRKIVLATSIAETSLTVEGVHIVIDSGLMRVPRFSPRTGMTRLETVPVSRASADQRRGRAGRLGPGLCLRMWTEQEDRQLPLRTVPEMLEADLAPLALELAAWGVTEPNELEWLDPPPAAAFSQAKSLLISLGAMDARGALTPHGRRVAELGIHPRLGHMLLKAAPLGLGRMACGLAAILGERDILKGNGNPDADIRLRLEALYRMTDGSWREFSVDRPAVGRVKTEAQQLERQLKLNGAGMNTKDPDIDKCGLLLAFAYPDRIAQRRASGRFLLQNGRGAQLSGMQLLSGEAWLAAAELDDQGVDSRIYLAAPVSLDELQEHFSWLIEEEALIEWDPEVQAVRAKKRERLGALILREGPLADPDPEAVVDALLKGIREEGLAVLPWTKAARQLQERLCFMHAHVGEKWPDMSDAALLASILEWLGPHVTGMKSRNELGRLQLVSILESVMSWNERRELDECAPTHIVVPSGSRIPIDYTNPEAPALNVRLQELFGWQETPRIAFGRVNLTMHLLSPAHRPVQVTRDLASFWRSGYFEVKKDLKGRYPKHYWPDDPLQAVPTNRAKPRV